jgi:hypothetical protein
MDREKDWDWVVARKACTARAMFEALRSGAKANVVSRNRLDDEGPKDPPPFTINERPPNGFTVSDSRGRARRVVDFDLDGHVIHVSRTMVTATSSFDVSVVLNDEGICKLKIRAESELDEWQVLKRALEPLFFHD